MTLCDKSSLLRVRELAAVSGLRYINDFYLIFLCLGPVPGTGDPDYDASRVSFCHANGNDATFRWLSP